MTALIVIELLSLLVPFAQRADWLSEWRAELLHVPPEQAISFSLGCIPDAVWLRCHQQHTASAVFRHPAACLLSLACLSLICITISFRLQAQLSALQRQPDPNAPDPVGLIIVYVVLAAGALLLGGPANLARSFCPKSRRSWLFLMMKISLLLPVFYCALALMSVVDFPPLTLVLLALNFALFCWAFADQKGRCPVCLRPLVDPIRVGCAAKTFLEWYGSESMCAHGHGLLHRPEASASYCGNGTWLPLDDSWAPLFSKEL